MAVAADCFLAEPEVGAEEVTFNIIKARLSKAEKAAAKQAWRREARKQQRQRKTDRLRVQWLSMTEEERGLARFAAKEDQRIVEERLQVGLMSGINVCIDLGFESEHSAKELLSLCKQLQLSYNVLKRSLVPVHLHVTSLGSLSQHARDLYKSQGVDRWKVDQHEGGPWDVFPKERLVFLTPDAETSLDRFEDSTIYIIGGVVDRSVRKSVTLNRALEERITVRRLPIQEYFPARRGSHILNIDAVLASICKHRELEDWTMALAETMPLRKRIEKACGLFAHSSDD